MTDYDYHESEHTWNAIAKSFDETRQKPWSTCLTYINSLPKHTIAADFGCGNGRHLIPLFKHCSKVIGMDLSSQLLHLTTLHFLREHLPVPPLIHGSITAIPLANTSIDAALLIASLHNIKGRTHRLIALKEIYRILKIKGTVLISVWTQEQERFRTQINKYNKEHTFEIGDIFINWNRDSLQIPRFYHLYQKDEFILDLTTAGFTLLSISEEYLVSKKYPDNYFAIVQKDG